VAPSRYFSDADNTVTGNGIEQGFREENEVQDLTFRADNTLQLPWRGALEFGIQHTQSEVNYDFVRNLSDTVSGTLGISGAADLTAGYASHQWQPTSDWDLTVGVRATKFEGTGEVYWDPRASLEYSLTDHISLKGALGLHHQFVKRIENEDILEGSRDFWVLADSVLPPGSAEHRIAGLSWENDDFLIDLEAYDKDLGGVSQFSTRYRARPDQEFEELFFSGTGFARGIEVLAQKKRGDLTGWISYTLGEVKYDLDGFNNDQPFSASQDQRHEFKAVGTYRLGRWTLASTWVFGSGTPYTLPESQYVLTLLDGTEMTYIHVGEKNGDRLPAYHRLDLAATWSFQNEIFSGDLSFSVFNAYGHDNIWYRQFDLSQTPMLLTDVTTLPFTPSLGVSLFFN
jgi:outer membrane receptor protein involved in Fe transport